VTIRSITSFWYRDHKPTAFDDCRFWDARGFANDARGDGVRVSVNNSCR